MQIALQHPKWTQNQIPSRASEVDSYSPHSLTHSLSLSLSTTTGASQWDKFQIERCHREDSYGSNCPETVQNPGTLNAFKLRGKQAGLSTLNHSETIPDLNWGRLDLGSEDRLPSFSGRFCCPLDRLIWLRDAQHMTTKIQGFEWRRSLLSKESSSNMGHEFP